MQITIEIPGTKEEIDAKFVSQTGDTASSYLADIAANVLQLAARREAIEALNLSPPEIVAS